MKCEDMCEAGKTETVAREIKPYQLGTAEVRWLNSGNINMNCGEALLFSGHDDIKAPHTERVTLMIIR